MYNIINSSIILAYLLSSNEQVTIEQIKDYRDRIRKLNPNIYVDITSNSLCSEIEHNSKLFKWMDDFTIARNQAIEISFQNGQIIKEFNDTIPEKEIVDILEKAIEY